MIIIDYLWHRELDMLTAKGKYGLKALTYLASLPPEATCQGVDIAAINNIPKRFLDAILGELSYAMPELSRARKDPAADIGSRSLRGKSRSAK